MRAALCYNAVNLFSVPDTLEVCRLVVTGTDDAYFAQHLRSLDALYSDATQMQTEYMTMDVAQSGSVIDDLFLSMECLHEKLIKITRAIFVYGTEGDHQYHLALLRTAVQNRDFASIHSTLMSIIFSSFVFITRACNMYKARTEACEEHDNVLNDLFTSAQSLERAAIKKIKCASVVTSGETTQAPLSPVTLSEKRQRLMQIITEATEKIMTLPDPTASASASASASADIVQHTMAHEQPSITAIKSEHEAAMATIKSEHETAMATKKSEHEAAMATKKSEHETAMATIKSEHETAMATIKSEHETAMATIKSDLETKHETAIAAMKNDLETKHETAIAAMKNDLETKHEAAIAAMKNDLETKHEAVIAAMKVDPTATNQAYISQEQFEGEIRDLKNQLTEAQSAHSTLVKAAIEGKAEAGVLEELHKIQLEDGQGMPSALGDADQYDAIAENLQQQTAKILAAAYEGGSSETQSEDEHTDAETVFTDVYAVMQTFCDQIIDKETNATQKLTAKTTMQQFICSLIRHTFANAATITLLRKTQESFDEHIAALQKDLQKYNDRDADASNVINSCLMLLMQYNQILCNIEPHSYASASGEYAKGRFFHQLQGAHGAVLMNHLVKIDFAQQCFTEQKADNDGDGQAKSTNGARFNVDDPHIPAMQQLFADKAITEKHVQDLTGGDLNRAQFEHIFGTTKCAKTFWAAKNGIPKEAVCRTLSLVPVEGTETEKLQVCDVTFTEFREKMATAMFHLTTHPRAHEQLGEAVIDLQEMSMQLRDNVFA